MTNEDDVSLSDLDSFDVDSVDGNNNIPSESEVSDGNISNHSDENHSNADDAHVVDVNNIIGNLGEGADMMQILNIPVNWTQNFKWISIKPFSQQSGPNLPENFDVTTATPKAYFGLFFTEEVFATICTNSNLYHNTM